MEWGGVFLLFNSGNAFGKCESNRWNPNDMSSLKLLKISLQICIVFANLMMAVKIDSQNEENTNMLCSWCKKKTFRFSISQQNTSNMFNAPCVMEQLH